MDLDATGVWYLDKMLSAGFYVTLHDFIRYLFPPLWISPPRTTIGEFLI